MALLARRSSLTLMLVIFFVTAVAVQWRFAEASQILVTRNAFDNRLSMGVAQ